MHFYILHHYFVFLFLSITAIIYRIIICALTVLSIYYLWFLSHFTMYSNFSFEMISNDMLYKVHAA